MGAIEIRRIDHVVLRVRDVAAAKRFYCNALGCTVERESDALGLYQLRAGAEGRNVDHVALNLAAFDEPAIRAQLTANGVAPGDVVERYGADGNGPSMYVRDPDGNVVELKGPPR